MMAARDDQRQDGSSARECYGAGQPKAAAAERVCDRRKSDSPVSVAEAFAIDRRAKVYSGGNWQKAGPEGTFGGYRNGQTGNNHGLVPAAGCPKVRRIEVSQCDRPSACFQRSSRLDSFAWQERIPAGATTGSSVLFPISATPSAIKRFGNVLRRHGMAPAPKRKPDDQPGKTSSRHTWPF